MPDEEDIQFEFFEELNRKYSSLETFILNWKCAWFENDIIVTPVTFQNVKKFTLVLNDKYDVTPATPPFAFPILDSLRLENIVRVTDEWINFVVKFKTIRSLSILTMFEAEYDTMTDRVIAGIAEKSNYENDWSFDLFGNALSRNGVKDFIMNCKNLVKLSMTFTEDHVDRFEDLEIPGWTEVGSAESFVLQKS